MDNRHGENGGHLEIRRYFLTEPIARRKLPTVGWWSVRSWVLNVHIHVKLAQQEKKSLWKAQANHFSYYLGFKAMLWNFQGIECMKQYDGRIAGVKKQNSRERFEKNEHSCSMEGVLIVSDSTAVLACPTRKTKHIILVPTIPTLTSKISKHRWASLAWLTWPLSRALTVRRTSSAVGLQTFYLSWFSGLAAGK